MVKAFSEDGVRVNFVDNGNTMKVKKSHLRPITPRLLTLPFQAIRCFLTGSVEKVKEQLFLKVNMMYYI